MNLEFIQKQVYHNSIADWLVSALIITVTLIIARLLYILLSRVVKVFTSKTETKLDDLLVDKLETPAIFCTILIGLNVALERLHFTPASDTYIHRAFVFLTAISITWFLVRVVHALIEEYLRPYSQREDNQLDEQVIMLVERGASLILWTLGVIAGLNNAGFDVGALIAGLGIGGLALALAAQDTVKNIFGGVMVFLDKPFKLGDRIKIGSFDGFVDYIGIRSTRIKTLEGRIVTIPNAQFSDSPIENITIEPARRIVTVLGLVYETSPEKLQEAIRILRNISDTSTRVINTDTLVFFENFGAYSLDIKFVYFIRKGEEIFSVQSEINTEILKRFNEAGLQFAYPTQTLYRK
ncbi:MAG: mechanosensitive ion channel family protein [Chitinophagales bacterium]|nr:mechanosensitive ion channel family protein [Chitinophagales bacterium]